MPLKNFQLCLLVVFFDKLTFLSQMCTFTRNLNHHWKCREQKENFKVFYYICPQKSVFNFFNHKKFPRPIWSVTFCKNVLMVPNFKLRIFFIILKSIYIILFLNQYTYLTLQQQVSFCLYYNMYYSIH